MSSPDPATGAPSDHSARAAKGVYFTTLCGMAIAFMLFQLAILRELRFQLTTLFTLTPFLFSSVIFFIALGSLCASRVGNNSRTILRSGILLLPLILLPAFALMLLAAHGQVGEDSGRFVDSPASASPGAGDAYLQSTILAFIAVGIGGYAVIFFLQGMLFALYFREAREEGVLPDVYGADLLASGVGALLGGVLAFVLTPTRTILVSEALFLACLWISRRSLGIPFGRAGLVTVAAAGMLLAELGAGVLSRLEEPGWFTEMTFSTWSRYRRIDAEDSPKYLSVYADGILFQMHDRKDITHSRDLRHLMLQAIERSPRPIKDVLIVGGGSGADVRILRDLLGDRLNITAVELDQGFIDTARASPWLWDIYKTAEIIVQEGRYFLENTSRTFDMVVYAYIDPQSTTGSVGIPDANFLYTDAGLGRALSRVRPGGALLISRVYLVEEQEEFARRMCATLERAGVPRENVHLYRDKNSFPWGYYGRLSTIHALIGRDAPPAVLEDPRIIPLAWQAGGKPTTDLFPFSFGTGVWFDTLLRYVTHNPLPIVLGGAILIAILLAITTSAGRATLFTLGFGSFMLESLVLFNSFLLFGDPNLSAAIAVGVFLLWNGLGSLLLRRVGESGRVLAALPILIAIYAVTAPLLNLWLISSPVVVRILVFSLHATLSGIPAGMAFPMALRRFPRESVPILFFVDVIGCALAPPVFWLVMNLWGLGMIIALAALAYAAVAVVLFRRLVRHTAA